MRTLFLITVLTVTAFSAEVKLSDYAKPNDALNDSVAFQEAVDVLAKAGGGTLNIDAGVWNMNSPVSFLTYKNVGNSFVIKGQKGAFIKPDLTSNQTLFVAGNQNQLLLENLIVVGDDTGDSDFDKFLVANYVGQLKIKGCQFFGLRANTSLISIGNTDAVIMETMFHGMASGDAVIRAEDFRGLSVMDTEFIDYGNLNGVYYSKTPYGNAAWIRATASTTEANALGQRALTLQNVRFDEGATYALDARGITYVHAQGVLANVSPVSNSAGFNFDNVKYAEVKMSKFGYTPSARPAVKATNNTTVYMDGVTLGDGVFYGWRDQQSQSFFNLKACSSGCVFAVEEAAP